VVLADLRSAVALFFFWCEGGDMERVVIVGGGMSGLIAAHVASSCAGVQAVILEPRALGGDFLMGGLKYIHKTAAMTKLMDSLGVVWADYTVKGGILLRGEVHDYPACLDKMAPDEAARIQADHYRKTRRMDIGTFGAKSMNDPGSGKSDRRALRCDPEELVDVLARKAQVIKQGVQRIEAKNNRVQIADGSWHHFHKCIVTIPLWVVHHMADFYVPEAMAMALNIVRFAPKRDPFVKWDYVYTPYTPGDAVHRLSAHEGGWDAEVNGEWEKVEARALDDLGSLFPEGFRITQLAKGLKGHLLDLPEPVRWPENIAPMGRFARWDPRATTDTTLDDMWKQAARWGWKATR
jgi:hypothetical protein